MDNVVIGIATTLWYLPSFREWSRIRFSSIQSTSISTPATLLNNRLRASRCGSTAGFTTGDGILGYN